MFYNLFVMIYYLFYLYFLFEKLRRRARQKEVKRPPGCLKGLWFKLHKCFHLYPILRTNTKLVKLNAIVSVHLFEIWYLTINCQRALKISTFTLHYYNFWRKNVVSVYVLVYKCKFLGMDINEGFIQGITPSYLTNKQHNIVGKWYFFVVSIIEQFIDMQGQNWR